MFKAIVSVPTTEPPEFISVRPIGCVQLLSPSKPVRFPHPNTRTLLKTPPSRNEFTHTVTSYRSDRLQRHAPPEMELENTTQQKLKASADNAKNITKILKTEIRSSNQRERQASTGETRRGRKCNPRTVRKLTLDVQACTKNTCVNGVEKPVGDDGPDRMQRLGMKSHVRGRWR